MTRLSLISKKITILIVVGSVLLLSSFVVPFLMNRPKAVPSASIKESVNKPVSAPIEALNFETLKKKLPSESEVKITFDKVYDYTTKSLGSISTLIGIIMGIQSLKKKEKEPKKRKNT